MIINIGIVKPCLNEFLIAHRGTVANMKKKIITRTKKTTAIDIVETTEVDTKSTASSPLLFKDFTEEIPSYTYPLGQSQTYDSDEDARKNAHEDTVTTDDEIIGDATWNTYRGSSNYNDSDKKIAPLPVTRNSKAEMAQKLLPSAIVGVGVGAAMMPVFNHLTKNSEQFGLDIHSNQNMFIVSTANTFIVASFSSYSMMYHFIKQHQDHFEPHVSSTAVKIAKVGASCSLVLPLGLLWGIELRNQQVAESHGFDEYVAWAAFTTVPLVIHRIIEAIKTVDDIKNNPEHIELNSLGSKLVVYGLAGLSVAGRTIAYAESVKALSLAVGIDSEISLGLGIVAGGLLGSGGDTVFEYQAIKSLFSVNSSAMTPAKVAGGIVATLEGAWFTLPLVSLGLNATQEWSPLLRGALYTPLFVSHSILEATRLYDNAYNMLETVTEGIKNMGCCGNNYDDLDV